MAGATGVSYGQSGGSGVSEATTIIGPARGSAYAREKWTASGQSVTSGVYGTLSGASGATTSDRSGS